MSDATFYKWRAKYGGLQVSDVKLKKLLAEQMLERVAREGGYPDVLTVDNGPELRGRALDGWADGHGVQLYFIDPGKPTQNASTAAFGRNA